MCYQNSSFSNAHYTASCVFGSVPINESSHAFSNVGRDLCDLARSNRLGSDRANRDRERRSSGSEMQRCLLSLRFCLRGRMGAGHCRTKSNLPHACSTSQSVSNVLIVDVWSCCTPQRSGSRIFIAEILPAREDGCWTLLDKKQSSSCRLDIPNPC